MNCIVQFMLLFAASVSGLAVGGSHGHGLHHRHAALAKKAVHLEYVTVCALGDTILSEADCEAGIASGRLVYIDSPVVTVTSTTSSVSVSHGTTMTGAKSTMISSIHSITEASKTSKLPKTSSASPTHAAPSGEPSSVVPTAKGLDEDFPNDIPCTEFPSDYGAIPIDYMNLGGWIGIQVPNIATAAGFDDIETVVSNLCDGEDCCVEGAFCSYACPPGYQKSQWPKSQGATGQSIGGIQCRNGILRLTNPTEKRLCIPGVKKVNVQVQNKLNGSVAICRTDYPGTEGMTIPLETYPGDIEPLTCPDQKTYYQWQGKATSGQYYVNNLNVPAFDACQWSDGEEPVGNWAPLNLGVGYANGAAYLAIFQNKPTTYSRLGFSVEIVASHMSGKCKYSHGKYCKGNDYQDCNDNDGCTVAVTSGNATFVLSYD